MTADPEYVIAELRQALAQCVGTLTEACNHITLQSEMQAALHRASDRVQYPPLHTALLQTLTNAHHALHWSGQATGHPASPPPIDLPQVTKLTPPPAAIHADERST